MQNPILRVLRVLSAQWWVYGLRSTSNSTNYLAQFSAILWVLILFRLLLGALTAIQSLRDTLMALMSSVLDLKNLGHPLSRRCSDGSLWESK